MVTDPAEHAYEKPLAAAMLFTNATYDKQMLAWLEKRLEAEGEFDRWMAAWSFGRAESAAKPAQQRAGQTIDRSVVDRPRDGGLLVNVYRFQARSGGRVRAARVA